MKAKLWFACTIAVAGLASAGLAFQEEKKPMQAGAGADAMAAAMKAYGTPGPAHKVLESKIGKWKAVGTMHMPGAAEPMKSEFTSEVKSIMNGLFVQETVTGQWMGQTFSGISTTGYDNIKKKYVSTWMDNMGSGIFHSEGTYDPATKTFTFTGEGPDCQSMTKMVKGRMVDKMTDADHGKMQSYQIGADGKEILTFELDYQRVK